MKFRLLFSSLLLTFGLLSLQGQCLQVTNIFVDACGPTEGENEMFTFEVGATPIAVNDISVTWPNNSFLGWCQNAGTAISTAGLNATIISSCGWLLEPVGGIIPAGAKVVVISSTNISLVDNSFEGLADTMYIIYQCSGNTAGHFANSGTGTRTLIVSTVNTCAGFESVTYDRGLLVGGDGASVVYDAAGNATYIDNGCNAPVVTLSAGWSFTNEICNDYGVVNLASLLEPNATLGGTWSGPRVTGSNYNPSGYTGLDSVTYSVTGTGSCSETLDSTFVFQVVSPPNVTFTQSACDSAFINGVWYTSDQSVVIVTPASSIYGCDSTSNITLDITTEIIDSTYIAACGSYTFNGITYTSSIILRDTLAGGGGSVSTCDDLYFSEYVEGSSNNKALEIYNGTGAPVNLATYTIERYTNGAATASLPVQALSGFLADGDVYVIYNPSSAAGISSVGDLSSGYINHNGDDAYALLNNGVIVDVFGNIGCDPGTEWTDLGNGTADNTYIRLPNYTTGAIDPPNAPCTIPSLSASNWISVDAIDVFTNLGTHTANCGSTSAAGCDTIVITNIVISPAPATATVQLCTNVPAAAGTQIDTLSNVLGCDSLITTTITTLINPTTVPVNLSACGSVTYQGTTYTASTNFSDTTSSALGCDSIYTQVNITVNQADTVQNPGNPFVICASNDSLLLPNGTYVFGPGTYTTSVGTTAAGCDSSVVTTVLTQNCDLTCTLETALFESYEFVGTVPGIVPGATFQTTTTEAIGIFAGRARTGSRFLYMNIQDGYTGLVYSLNMDVCPGSEFDISFWMRQYDNGPGSNFNINIYDGPNNAAPLLSTQNIVNSGTVYNQRTTPTLIASGSVITFELFTIAPGANGNDICFDDLTLRVCQIDTLVLPAIGYCNNESPENLYNYVSSVVGTNGTWAGPSALSNGYLGTFNPTTANNGSYFYTKPGTAACNDTVVRLDITVADTITTQNPGNPFIICSASDSVLLPGGSYAYTAGTYSFTYVGGAAAGCDSTVVSIVQTEVCFQCLNDFDLGNDTSFCSGPTLVLNAGAGYDTYLWQNGSTNPTFTVSSSGTYYCTATETDFTNNLVVNGDFEQGNTGFTTDYGPPSGGFFNLNAGEYEIVTVSSHPNLDICASDHTSGSGNMMVVNGSIVPSTNVWCQTISVEQNTNYIFSAWVISLENTNLANVSTLHFLVNGVQIGPNFSPSLTACNWQQFFANYNSGSNTSIQICIESDVISGNNDYAIDDIFFTPVCAYTDTVVVTVNPFPLANLGNDSSTCVGESIILNATTPNATYAWQNGTTAATLNATTSGLYWVDVTVNSCTDRDSINLVFSPNFSSITTLNICNGDSAFLAGAWQTAPGVYTDIFSTPSSCDSTITTTLNVSQSLEINQTITVCANELPVLIFGNEETQAGVYNEIILSTLGCDSLITNITLVVNSNPVVSLGNDTTIQEGSNLQLSVSNPSANETYAWSNSLGQNFAGANIQANNTETATYTLVVTNEFSCEGFDTILVIVNPLDETFIQLPTAFSPNADGTNDVFRIANFQDFDSYILRVYNRWGELIFDNEGFNVSWDGTYKGVDQNVGSFVYYIDAQPTNGAPRMTTSGNVTLIR